MTEKPGGQKNFLSDPKIVGNYNLLQEIGVIRHIGFLEREIQSNKDLLACALDIFNRTTINEIVEATTWHIFDRFMPSSVVFLWKPMQNREDIVIKSYKNYKQADLHIKVDSISSLEPFFKQYPRPINYELFSYQIGYNRTVKAFEIIKPELVIPILGPSGLYGLVLVGYKNMEKEFTNSELEILQNLMSFVSKAIQNNLHYERTLRDLKTGLYNNGFLLTRLNEEIARANRNMSKASLIMMDVDKFKNFNDSYGHIAGDRVLESLAITIKQGVRVGDVPSRFGGEEFSILLPDTDKDVVWYVAERLRDMVADMKVPWEPPLPRVTISLGIFTFDESTNLPAEEIIKRADEALYLSKLLGRNRSTAWGEGLLRKIQRKKLNT
jgi:diguanylate cyclase (GGDEF)-like protein